MMAGVNPGAVQRILRHSDPRITTETYGHLQPDYLRSEIDRLRFNTVPANDPSSGSQPSAALSQKLLTRTSIRVLSPVGRGRLSRRESRQRARRARAGWGARTRRGSTRDRSAPTRRRPPPSAFALQQPGRAASKIEAGRHDVSIHAKKRATRQAGRDRDDHPTDATPRWPAFRHEVSALATSHRPRARSPSRSRAGVKVLMFTSVVDRVGTWYRAFNLASALVRRGHEVTVVKVGVQRIQLWEQVEAGVSVVELPRLWGSSFFHRATRMPHDIAGRVALQLFRDFDVVHGFTHLLNSLLPAWIGRWIKPKTVVIGDRDDLWANGGLMGDASQKRWLDRVDHRFNHWTELKMGRWLGTMTVVSDDLLGRLLETGVDPRRVRKIINGCAIDRIRPCSADTRAAARPVRARAAPRPRVPPEHAGRKLSGDLPASSEPRHSVISPVQRVRRHRDLHGRREAPRCMSRAFRGRTRAPELTRAGM